MNHAPAATAGERPQPAAIGLGDLSAAKLHRGGTHRSAAPEETLERARRVARAIGVTRFADITHLDRIGIPAILAVRPAGGWLSVDAGKGLTTMLATVSAAMECIERHHAETARLPGFRATWAALRAQDAVPDPDGLLLARASLFHPEAEQTWTWTWDVAGDRPLAVPRATLGAQPRRRRWDGDALDFQVTSNGLASGNHLLEAICAGLYEVIERDAIACWGRRVRLGRGDFRRVDGALLEAPAARDLVARFEAAEVEPLVFDFTTDLGVPTYAAYVFDRRERHGGYFRGFGTHLDPAVAVLRALTEAAQCRAIMVAGSRDDVFWAELVRTRRRDGAAWYDRLRALEPTPGAGLHPDASTPTFEGDLAVLLDRLAAAGLDRAGVLDLTRPEHGIPVVRVVVPGLEGYETTTFYRPGARARAFARA